MQHSNINATRPIDNQLVLDKYISLLNIAKSISKKIFVKALSAKLLVKPLPRDKSFGLEPGIRFYDREDGDGTEKIEEAETLVVCDSSLVAYKQNLAKIKFPYIDMFDHEGPLVIHSIRDLTVGVLST